MARDGICLLGEAAFERFRESAFWRRIDSGWWRQAEKRYLSRFLRGEVALDTDLIRRRLIQMTQYLSELEMVIKQSLPEFVSNPLLLRTAERDTELLVECAAKINTAIGQAKGIPPSDDYSSFFPSPQIGWGLTWLKNWPGWPACAICSSISTKTFGRNRFMSPARVRPPSGANTWKPFCKNARISFRPSLRPRPRSGSAASPWREAPAVSLSP